MEEIKEKSEYCLNCKIKPCSNKGCPLGNDIPTFIKAIKEENYKKAYEILSGTTVLEAVCGRICPHTKQCEGSCVRGIKSKPVSIGELEAFVGDISIKENYKILYEKLSLFGVNIINNECIKLFLGKDSICICGIDDPCFVNERGLSKKEVIENNLSKIKIDIAEFNILLSHRPEMIKVYASYGYDLVFTGHAHGGQFRIPFIGGIFAPNQVFFPKYTSGKHVVSHTVEIISRGLGPSIIPIRIFNRPEIVVCKLKSIK